MARPVPVNAPAVAAFDLDGTLTARGSVVPWLTDVAGRPAVRRAVVRHAPALAVGAVRSGSAADRVKEALFETLLKGRDLDDVTAVSAAFADAHLRRALRPEVVARLQAHLDLGHGVVVVSASPALYVARVAEALGAHGTAATDLAVDADGALTGRYDGPNCRGEEKLRKVTALLARLGLGVGHGRVLYAYGNSRGDLRLLESADHPVDVSMLGGFGQLRRFPRLDAVPL